jgi:hypothetical protein
MSPETESYLLDIQKQGYKVVLASGRPTEGMLPTSMSMTTILYLPMLLTSLQRLYSILQQIINVGTIL